MSIVKVPRRDFVDWQTLKRDGWIIYKRREKIIPILTFHSFALICVIVDALMVKGSVATRSSKRCVSLWNKWRSWLLALLPTSFNSLSFSNPSINRYSLHESKFVRTKRIIKLFFFFFFCNSSDCAEISLPYWLASIFTPVYTIYRIHSVAGNCTVWLMNCRCHIN